MTGRDRDIEKAQRMMRERFGEGSSPSEELIRERRGEAAILREGGADPSSRGQREDDAVDWAGHNRRVAESEGRRVGQAALFLEFVRRNLRTQLSYRPGVMGEDEAAEHMHGLVTSFYAKHVLRVVQPDRSEFDEMYRLLELASLATIVAVEGYDWEGFPELEGFAGTSPQQTQPFYRVNKEAFSKEEVLRALTRVRETVREDRTRAGLGEDFSGAEPDEKGIARAEAIEEGLNLFRDALLGGEG